jgi:hypothetical protein
MTKISNGATLYSETDGYDAVGNVASVNTTLPTGTDNQGVLLRRAEPADVGGNKRDQAV